MISVLIADDSNYMRTLFARTLESDRLIRVVGTAQNGAEAVEMVRELKPDVVTMDINMPIMNGAEAVERIMAENPVPIIVVTANSIEGSRETTEAIAKGAVDYIRKPSGEVSTNIEAIKDELISKVKKHCTCQGGSVGRTSSENSAGRTHLGKDRRWRKPPFPLVVIGSSTGGTKIVTKILSELPANIFCGFIIVQHMQESHIKVFAEQLNNSSALIVEQATDNRKIEPGLALLAPSKYNVLIRQNGEVYLEKALPGTEITAAVNTTMKNIATVFCEKSIGVILSGMGRDGVEGLKEIKKFKGITIAQSKGSCVVSGMPGSAIDAGVIDTILPPGRISHKICEVVKSLNEEDNSE